MWEEAFALVLPFDKLRAGLGLTMTLFFISPSVLKVDTRGEERDEVALLLRSAQ